MKTTIYEPTPEDRERWRLMRLRALKQRLEEHNRIRAVLKAVLVKEKSKLI